jgi:lipopolysaccharide export system protein LptA
VALVIACAATAQEAKPGLKLTEDELLRQIESLSPNSGDPLTKAPASITGSAPTPRVPVAGGARGGERAGATSGAGAAEETPPPKKQKGETVIKADAVDFDQKTHQAVFTGRVFVHDPEFDLTCDKLTAFLKNDKPATGSGATATPAPKASEAAKGSEAPKKGGGLERAVAEGNVVITQEKIDADGKPSKSVGRAARADYSATTGETILIGNPEVQQGINTCVATDPSTKMYMKRDGKMRVEGPSTMIIRDQGNSKEAR